MIKRTYGYDMNLDVNDLTLKEDNIFEYFKDYNCLYLDSGRSCIKIISQLARGKEILVPSFSCNCVVHGFIEDTKPVFYKINTDFSIDFIDLEKKITEKTAILYITNYYGHHISDEDAKKVKDIKEKTGVIIVEDNTQSVFSGDPKVGDYGIASIRKWFPVPDGGLLYTKNELDVFDLSMVEKGSMQREKLYPQIIKDMYLKGMIDYNAEKIAALFDQVEFRLNDYADMGKIFFLDDFTKFMYQCHSVKNAIEKRKENYRYMLELIDSPYIDFAMAPIGEDECPFNIPVYCKYRDEMCEYLHEKFEIYPSVLWKTHTIDWIKEIPITKYMGESIMCIPVDQRYDKSDMEHIAKAINGFRKE